MSALVYVVSPLDAIPDAIPVVGLADDFAVLTALFASFASMSIDLEQYEKGGDSRSVELMTREGTRSDDAQQSTDGFTSEIDSDFDIDDFHDCEIDDDYVEIEEEEKK